MLVLLAARFGRADVPTPCEPRIVFPVDGETAVPTDAALRVAVPPCVPGRPTLTNEEGQELVFDLIPATGCGADGCRDVRPVVPFTADSDFVLTIPATTPDRCGRPGPTRARFHTGVRPAFLRAAAVLLSLRDGTGDETHALTLDFSEALDKAWLDDHPELITVTRDDGAKLIARIDPGGAPALSVLVTFKANTPRPAAGTRFRVKISKDLKFVSGGALPADVEFVTAFGVFDGLELTPCPQITDAGCLCSGSDGAGLLAIGFALARRRRRA